MKYSQIYANARSAYLIVALDIRHFVLENSVLQMILQQEWHVKTCSLLFWYILDISFHILRFE